MDIADIKSFLAFAELRSLTLAAKQVHVTQSAMSKRIHKIENELGVRLFIVDRATINLTEEAKAILPYMREMHAAFESMTKTIKETSSTQQRILTGASVFASHYVLPSFINYLQTSNSTLNIHILTPKEEYIESKLSRGEIDVAVFHEINLPSTHIVKKILWEEPFYLVTSFQNELTHKSNISYQDLLSFPGVFTKRGMVMRSKIEQQFPEATHTSPKIVEVSTLESARNLLEYNMGWSYLPKKLISSKLKILDENNPFIIPYCVYYLKSRKEENRIQSFLDALGAWLHPDSQENKILW